MPSSPEQSDVAAKKHAYIMKYWAFSGWSAKKISEEFSRDETLRKEFPKGVSIESVIQHIRKIRIELEKLVDEDALEKYTSEFIRKQFQYDEQIDNMNQMQNSIETDDGKGKELWLKFEAQKTTILDKQIKMMSDIELVLMIKQINARRRKEIKTLNRIPEKALEHRVVPEVEPIVDLSAPIERLEKSEVKHSKAKKELEDTEEKWRLIENHERADADSTISGAKEYNDI